MGDLRERAPDELVFRPAQEPRPRDITAEVEQAEQLTAARRERDTAWAVSQDLLAAVALDGKFTSVNAAVVTQASSAIPGVPLYLALITPVLAGKKLLEHPIDQILRLMRVHSGPGRTPVCDAEGRIRMDDWEMRDDVQSVVTKGWNEVTAETLTSLADLDGFQREFRRLFGFGVPGVDESQPVEIDVPLEG